jgi:outer membrane biosynthesis protein TonB
MVFDKAAKRAVSRWNFRPAPAGKDVASADKDNEQKLRLNFNLKKALASEDSSSPSL